METKDRVRQFIETNFYVPEGCVLEDSASLIDQGIVDSTGVLELIAFIETELGVRVLDAEVLPENLDSIDRICAFVGRKQRRLAG